MGGGGQDDSRLSTTGAGENRPALLDGPAFARLYGLHAPAVKAYLAKHGWSEHTDDFIQEVFLRAWRSRQSYRGDSSFQTYLVGIARKVAIEHLRRQARESDARGILPPRTELLQGTVAGTFDRQDSVFAAASDKDLQEVVLRTVAGMPAIYRQAIELAVLSGLSIAEAAKQAGCETAAFKKRLYRGLAQLRGEIPDCE